jgi:hypothetical protein
MSFLGTRDSYEDAVPDPPPQSAGDIAAFAAIDSAYEESRMAIQEGNEILRQIASDTIMGDETAHKKRRSTRRRKQDKQ